MTIYTISKSADFEKAKQNNDTRTKFPSLTEAQKFQLMYGGIIKASYCHK